MKRHKISSILILIMVFSLVFSFQVLAQGETEGDRLIVAFADDPGTFDVQMNTAPPKEVRELVFDPLFALGADIEPHPVLAEEWEYNEEDLYWDIKIREGVEFHDGQEVTSADVLASFERFMDVGARRFELDPVEEMEILDEYTVRFHLESPFGDLFLASLCGGGGPSIYPEWLVEEYREEEITDNFVGSGVYKVEEIAVGEYYILTRNEDYQPNPQSEGAGFLADRTSYIDELEIRIIEEDAARLAALQAGDVDLIQYAPLDDFETIQADPNLEALPGSPGMRIYYVLNTFSDVMDDVLLRKGIRAGLPTEDLMLTLGPEELWRINHTPRYQEEQPWWVDYSHLYPNDMELAQKLVEASDYDGEEIVFLSSPGRPEEYRTVIVMEEYLRDLGLNVEIRSVDAATFGDVRAQMDEWDIKHSGGGSNISPVYLPSSFNNRRGEWWPTTEEEIVTHLVSKIQQSKEVEDMIAPIHMLYHLNAEYANEFWLGEVFQVAAYWDYVKGVQDSFKLPLFGLQIDN